jgi:NADH dehydrogenase FAD-containing subunit
LNKKKNEKNTEKTLTSTMTTVNKVLVESAIVFLRVILLAIDVPLGILQTAKAQLLPSPKTSSGTKTVVIVGGNFAGLAALETLKAHRLSGSNIILIDQRSYSEYTPGILRLFCAPEEYHELAQPLPCSRHNYRLIQGKVTSLIDNHEEKVLAYETGNSTHTIRYDYVILATGSTYDISTPISPTPQEMTLQGRYDGWKAAHQTLQRAKSVIVLGGGAVGVELTAEIVEHFPRMRIRLLDAAPRLVSNFSDQVSDYALQWLQNRGVDVRLGQSIQSWTETSCTLQDGTVLTADLVYVCFGSKPNSDMVKSSSSLLCSLTKQQNIQVRDTLQVVAASGSAAKFDTACIFACGDVSMPQHGGQDQAFQAEIQGNVAAINVLRLLKDDKTTPLCRYPHDMTYGASEMPMVYILSLGKHDGVLGFNALIIPGPLAAIFKFVLEYTKVLEMRGSLLGRWIWKIADASVLFLSSTVLPPVPKDTTTTKQIKAA